MVNETVSGFAGKGIKVLQNKVDLIDYVKEIKKQELKDIRNGLFKNILLTHYYLKVESFTLEHTFFIQIKYIY